MDKHKQHQNVLQHIDSSNYVTHLITERADKTIAVGRIDKYSSVTHKSLLLYDKGLSMASHFNMNMNNGNEMDYCNNNNAPIIKANEIIISK